jgi:hypothetical protein
MAFQLAGQTPTTGKPAATGIAGYRGRKKSASSRDARWADSVVFAQKPPMDNRLSQ